MKVGDLIEYKPNLTGISNRIGVVMEVWMMDNKTQYLCHWNIPDTATQKVRWYAPAEDVQLCKINNF